MIEKVRVIQDLPSYKVDLNTAQGVAVYSQTLPVPTKDAVLGGWKYEKDSANPSGKFIYYYKQHEALSPILIRNLRRFYMICTLQSATAYVDVPFLLTYTLPQGDGLDAETWYRTRVSYSISNNEKIYNGMQVMLWAGPGILEPSEFPNLKKIRLTARTVNGPDVGDEILNFISAHSDSGTATNYKATVHNLGWSTSDVHVLWDLV
tara:strand:- start:1075 stop:1692 length:618 start_codon:yes stop_codon:yes gene_type:complete